MEVDTSASAAAAAAASSGTGEARTMASIPSLDKLTKCDKLGRGGTSLLVRAGPRRGRIVKFFGDNGDGTIQLLAGTGKKAMQWTEDLKNVEIKSG